MGVGGIFFHFLLNYILVIYTVLLFRFFCISLFFISIIIFIYLFVSFDFIFYLIEIF